MKPAPKANGAITTESGPPKRILLASDLTARTDRAMDRAVLLAKAHRSSLGVLYVIDTTLLPARVARRDLRDAKASVEREIAEAGAGKLVTTAFVAAGDAAAAIAERARSEKVDLIVVGSGSYGTLAAAFRGTTVDRVIRSAACPVLTVKVRPRQDYRTIVAAHDGGDAAQNALTFALRAFPRANVSVIHIHEGDEPIGKPRQEIERRVRTACAAARKATSGGSSGPRVIVKTGRAEEALEREAVRTGADLIVAGTHGRRGVSKLLLGSVAEALVAGAACDVLVARA